MQHSPTSAQGAHWSWKVMEFWWTIFQGLNHHHHTTTVLQPFFRDHPGEPVPEENFWTLWCKGRLTEADTQTIWLGATPCGLTIAHLHHPPFFTGQMPFLPPNQLCQSTEGRLFRPGKSWKIGNQQRSWKVLENDDNIMEILQLHWAILRIKSCWTDCYELFVNMCINTPVVLSSWH